MKKTRWIVALSASLAMLLGVSLVAAGCTDPEPEPQPQPKPTTYTVTYEKGEDEEGTAPEVKSYEAGASVTLAAANTFTKEGYTFTKWLEGTTEYDAGATYTMPEKNVTFKAKWAVAENADPASKTLIAGNNKLTLTADDADDYNILCRELTFTGAANTNYTLKYTVPELEENVYSLIQLYKPEAYEDGEPLFDGETNEYVFKTDANGKAEFVIDGGWYDEDDYDADLVTATLSITKGGVYKYTVVFYKEASMVGQSMAHYAMLQVAENTEIGEEDFPADLEKIGYTFGGWYVAEEVASQYDPEWLVWAPSDDAITKDTLITADIYVLPKWTKVEVAGDGKTELAVGDNEIVLGSNDKDSMDYLYREMTLTGTAGDTYTLTLTDSENVSVFLGEENYDEGNYMEEYYSTVVAIPAGGVLTVIIESSGSYAENHFGACKITVEEGGEFVWEVSFYNCPLSSIGRFPYTPVEVADGEAIGEDNMPDTSSETGSLFLGWYVIEMQGYGPGAHYEYTDTEVTKDTVVTGDLLVAAKWIKLPSVTFSNGLTGDDEETEEATASDYTLEEGEDGNLLLTLPAADKFSRTGYTLVGWQLVDTDGEPVDDQSFDCEAQLPFAVDEIDDGVTITLVAVWQANEQEP